MATTQSNNLSMPMDIQQKLQELELELAEGDITQKGFEKKRIKLLGPYQQKSTEIQISNNTNNNNNNNNHHHEKSSNRSSKIQCRRQKRDGYNRYHSDVRQEAVKQALEQFGARPIPSSKRIINSQTNHESSDDDDEESSSTYATTTDDQQNKESSISPIPIPIQHHHYQNPPTVESIIKNIQAPPPLSSTFLSDFIHRSQEPSLSNIECDLTRSAGARYRDSNSDYVNTTQQHYVLYGDRNSQVESSIPITNAINHQNEGEDEEFLMNDKSFI